MNTSQPISPKPASRPERLDGTQDTDPIADRPHPNVLEQAVIELRQDVPADGVFIERFGVLGKSKGLEPFPEIGHGHSPRFWSYRLLRIWNDLMALVLMCNLVRRIKFKL